MHSQETASLQNRKDIRQSLWDLKQKNTTNKLKALPAIYISSFFVDSRPHLTSEVNVADARPVIWPDTLYFGTL